MYQYQSLLEKIMIEGEDRDDRTGVGTRSIFGTRMEFDLSQGFPAVTTKKLAFKSVMGELLWFLNGKTDLHSLRFYTFGDGMSDKKTIWDANQESYVHRRNKYLLKGVGDDCGNIYGELWHYNNQFWNAVKSIERSPTSRRIMVNAWIPRIVNDDLKVALPPCHYGFQLYVHNDGRLDLMWNQRSVDAFLGLPFNIASYAALVHIICHVTGKKPGKLIFIGGDTHIYHNHFDAVEEQLNRKTHALPEFVINEPAKEHEHAVVWVSRLQASDFELKGYNHGPAIKADMAV